MLLGWMPRSEDQVIDRFKDFVGIPFLPECHGVWGYWLRL